LAIVARPVAKETLAIGVRPSVHGRIVSLVARHAPYERLRIQSIAKCEPASGCLNDDLVKKRESPLVCRALVASSMWKWWLSNHACGCH
jgi:hypothetical protein